MNYEVKVTEKAINVKHDETGMTVWLPKSSLEFVYEEAHSFTLKQWFRSKLKSENNTCPLKALGIIS